jgi:hypothetical protein
MSAAAEQRGVQRYFGRIGSAITSLIIVETPPALEETVV